MVWDVDKKDEKWTDQSLGEAINRFKEKQDFEGLTRFLETRLADDDPCCVSARPRFWNELGLTAIINKNHEQAGICFENALLLAPDYTAAQYNLATLNMQQGELSLALERYDRILETHPDHFGALFNAGVCHSHADDKTKALPLFMRAAKLKPDHGQVQFLTGEILLQEGRAGEALPFFQTAHKINHGHFESSQGLAIALLENKRYDEAVNLCDQTLISFGAATLPLQVKADAMLALDRIEEAVQCHMDLCHIDLDIREFVITRIEKLATENPEAFSAYASIVHDRYPDFKLTIDPILKKKEPSEDF